MLLRNVHEIERGLPDGFSGPAEIELCGKVSLRLSHAVVEVDAAYLEAGNQLDPWSVGTAHRLPLRLELEIEKFDDGADVILGKNRAAEQFHPVRLAGREFHFQTGFRRDVPPGVEPTELPVAFEKFDGEAGDAAAGALDGGAEDLGYLRREAANGFDDRSVEIVLDRDPGPNAAGDRFCRTFCRIEVDPSVGQSDGDRCEAQIPEGGGFSEEFGGKLRPTVDAEGVGFRRIKIHCQPLLVALVEGRVDSPDLLAVPKKFDGEIRCFRPVGLNGGGETQPNPFGWILYKLFQRGIQRIGAADLHRDPRRRRGLEFNRLGGLAPSGGDSGVEPVEIGIDKFRGGERQRRENGEKQRQLHDSALLSFVIIVPEIVAVGAAVGAAAAAHQLRMRFGIDMEIDVQDVSGLSVAAADLLLLQNRIG